MEILVSILVGILFTAGLYLVMARSLLRIVLGTAIIGHGALLLMLTTPGLQQGEPPITGGDAVSFSDPLPQALILTAIVINFATMGFFLVLAYRSYKELGTDDMDKLRGTEDD
ncbi:Na(+) H(+) antiporter subunit C [Geomicrobium sp. JCM 19037]|uniref:Na(+)/H(+) antiporter subunit C n=1 Tax=unclassified Geomicrobium TaxID=2628951 RepID=UPI00045F3023|nr:MULTISPECIES: Na(+)/H(+) antiporter subunit C [unclassified Geomicrobium]GAK02769.1 Na(+) H(+) antiporter subunit C [Geomicrobium sp. JCM 19037]GAK10630.1 Na(+) H(+) antiporter subunit C [Geomicrobium sp. JCM 19039]